MSLFFFSSRRRHTRSLCDWSSDVCSSDLKELGVGDFDLEIWNAVAAPKAMPAAHVQKLAEAVSEIARSPEMRARLAAQGWQAVGSSPEGLSLRIRQDVTALGRIIREQGIHAQ